MRRRDFISLVGAAAAWPLAADGQPSTKLPTVGFIVPDTLAAERRRVAAFSQRLRELGWIEGRNIVIDVRAAEGQSKRLVEIANEFVALNVNLIVTFSSPAVAAAKQATSVIPIIFAASGDPLGMGIVDSLARPGGNVTGISLQQRDLGGKRLELLHDALPGLRRLAIMGDGDNAFVPLEINEVQTSARTLGLDVVKVEIRRTDEIARAFVALKGTVEALYVIAGPLMNTNRIRMNTWALAVRLPTIYGTRENVEVGGLMSYGPNFLELFRRSGDIADKVLRGTKPAEIPVEQPTKFELVLNLITAEALGLEIPATLLARADEVIE
jgi:putative ABC transport system substrate-binding protein